MKRLIISLGIPWFSIWPLVAQAQDPYRYLHVTLDTVWMIFLFLLPAVLFPMVLAVWLYWRYSRQTHDAGQDDNE